MVKQLFITGTDTDVGKTTIAEGLLKLFSKNHIKTLGLKPVAAGCNETPEGRQNLDAVILKEASTLKLSYPEHNFVALSKPIAPHIAAFEENLSLNVEILKNKYLSLLTTYQSDLDIILIEGAGGWLVPLNSSETMADFVKAIECEVILVVGIKLGCLNHTLLTIETMKNQSISLAGWIANCIDSNMAYVSENVDILKQKIPAPLLGVVPFKGNAADHINLKHLKNMLN